MLHPELSPKWTYGGECMPDTWIIVAIMLALAVAIAIAMLIAMARDVEADKRDVGGVNRKRSARIDLFRQQRDEDEDAGK